MDRAERIENCKFCSFTHLKGRCPAYNKRCNKCQKKGHFKSRCMSKAINQVANKSGSDSSNSDTEEVFVIGTVTSEIATEVQGEEINVDFLSEDWSIV